MQFDHLIKGGTVIDGSGKARRKADVGIRDSEIAAIGDLSGATSKNTHDADGMVVCPGFIDMHSHADQTVLLYPGAESALAQGITTTVGGNCGFSAAPLHSHYTACFWEWNWWNDVAPRKYYEAVVGDLELAKKAALETDGLNIDWSTFAQWLERVDRAEPGINLVPLVGHSSVRSAVMGEDYRRFASEEEIEAMKRYVAEAMDAGAFGISNGLDYAPNSYCSFEESCALVKESASRGGLFASHWRRTGLREGFGSPGLANGIKEAINIAREADSQLQIAHLSPGYLVSPNATPKLALAAAEETLSIIDKAIDEGLNVAFDCIPNSSGGVLSCRYLATMLSPWLNDAGSLEQLSRNLRAPDLRREITDYIMAGRWYSLNPITQPGWAKGVRLMECTDSRYVGLTISEIAKERGQKELDALMDMVMIDPRSRPAFVMGPDKAKDVFYSHPRAMVGIDVFLLDPTYEVTVPPYYFPHPNTFGGMARFLRIYANGLLGLEEGIRRLTSLPASTLGLSDRGMLKQGDKADVVVFNPDTVREIGDEREPRQYPAGFEAVFVNGCLSMRNGTFTNDRNGVVLTR